MSLNELKNQEVIYFDPSTEVRRTHSFTSINKYKIRSMAPSPDSPTSQNSALINATDTTMTTGERLGLEMGQIDTLAYRPRQESRGPSTGLTPPPA